MQEEAAAAHEEAEARREVPGDVGTRARVERAIRSAIRNSERNSERNSAQFSAILTAQFSLLLQADEKQMQDMQANLKETGMSGTMYRREDLAGMMDKMKDMVSARASPLPRNSLRIL